MDKTMTVHRERRISEISAGLKPGDPATDYFQSLFSTSDAERYGWSPLHTYPSGVELYRQNDPASHIYFIERGIVKISCIGPGGEEVIISLRRRNWLLGATQVIVDKAYLATATTLTPCSLRCISAGSFMAQLTADSALSMELNRVLSLEVRRNVEKIITLECMSATERLRSFLCELISYEDKDDLQKKGRLELPLAISDLAEILAVTPQHLYRILKDPELRVHLKQSKKILSIDDPLTFLHKQPSEG